MSTNNFKNDPVIKFILSINGINIILMLAALYYAYALGFSIKSIMLIQFVLLILFFRLKAEVYFKISAILLILTPLALRGHEVMSELMAGLCLLFVGLGSLSLWFSRTEHGSNEKLVQK